MAPPATISETMTTTAIIHPLEELLDELEWPDEAVEEGASPILKSVTFQSE